MQYLAIILLAPLLLYLIWLIYQFLKISDIEYQKRRKELLHPESNITDETVKSIVMKNGKFKINTKMSIGSAKRFIK